MNFTKFIDSSMLSLPILEEMYALYKQNPENIDPSWRSLFAEMEASEAPSVSSGSLPASPSAPALLFEPDSRPVLPPEETSGRSVIYHPKIEISGGGDLRIFNLINAYRTYGHLLAKNNPLQLLHPIEPEQLKLETLGFSKKDLSLRFPSCGLFEEEEVPLLDIINALKATYCDKIGVEYMGFLSPELESWIQQQVEPSRFKISLPIEQKQMILQHLNKSELFESFLHTKYVGQKRFSLEGGETMIPVLAAIIEKGSSLGTEDFILGMAHRGRLNVLCNILDKSYADIFSEFEEGYISASVEGSGDVKYHKGFYSEIKTVNGHKVKIVLTPNPSHLESVGPVVEGQVRAKQDLIGKGGQDKVIPLLVHGDAAISGQGVVYETLQLCRLAGYTTGGTIHIIINNQIGFTTVPEDSRSTHYCTDIAHAFGSPVFHVSAEDPEGCVYAANLALELRQKFHCDVFIELICYRKYGHNETDEPAFTQPLEYHQIRKKRPIREIYRDSLVSQGVLEKNVVEALEDEFKKALQQSLKGSKISAKDPSGKPVQQANGSNGEGIFQHIQTGVQKEELKQIAERICYVPEGFSIHPKLALLTKERLSMLKDGEGARLVDWGMGELLAYGSLLWNGINVRISGQDTCRGTFSHRHALLMDQVKEEGYVPLQHLKQGQGRFDLFNSPLSEYAVLGFEYGYSIANLAALVVWEAQFGDFANGAQIIIDQFIASAEQKWNQKSGLTLLLPHGYEGQGPEHSSARIERFLSLAGDNNILIVQPTTPAQFFHLLRRQMLRRLRKPLIVFTPKGLLRHHACVSRIDDFTQGSFQELLDDSASPKAPKRLAFCSGRIYYDLIAEREKTGNAGSTAIVRIEQIYPLDRERLKEIIGKYAGFAECAWVQDEPGNMGAWDYIRPILRELLPKGLDPVYIGRERSASPATGSHALHKKEHVAIANALFGKEGPTIFEIAGQFKA